MRQTPENIVLSNGDAVVVRVCVVVAHPYERFSKPPPSATRPSLHTGSAATVLSLNRNRAESRPEAVLDIHYNTGKVFLLRFLTHAQYSKERWKDEL